MTSGYQHNTAACDHGPDCLDCTPIFATLILNAVLDLKETIMTESQTAQQHLDAGVASMRDAFSTAAELKAQIAAGVQAPDLNFAGFDQLVTDEQAEATADAPVVTEPAAGGDDSTGTPTDGSTPDAPAPDAGAVIA